jgi:hypothetical protein
MINVISDHAEDVPAIAGGAGCGGLGAVQTPVRQKAGVWPCVYSMLQACYALANCWTLLLGYRQSYQARKIIY